MSASGGESTFAASWSIESHRESAISVHFTSNKWIRAVADFHKVDFAPLAVPVVPKACRRQGCGQTLAELREDKGFPDCSNQGACRERAGIEAQQKAQHAPDH